MKREQVASLVGFYAQRLLPSALGILALPWLFEVAGPITYQRYSLVILLMGAISMLCGTWITQSAVRNLSRTGYDRPSMTLMMQLLALSSVGAAAIAAVVLRWAFPDIGIAPFWICLATILLTLQTTILPVVQSVGKHVHCLLSELIRTIGPVVVIGIAVRYQLAGPSTVEMGVAVATAVSLAPMWPAVRSVFATATKEAHGPLRDGLSMLRYGGPLSIYNGLSLWLQYMSRTALIGVAGTTPVAGSLIMATDLAQKIVGSASAPLIASQVPSMVVAHNEGRTDAVEKKARLLQALIILGCVILLACIFFAHLTSTWIFQDATVAACSAIAVIGNMFLQMATCSQKQLEFKGATASIALSMAIAALISTTYIRHTPIWIQTSLPGLDLTAAGVLLYILVLILRARIRHE